VKKSTIIVAMDRKNGIGAHNTMPWSLKEDMAHFRRTTTGHPVIMGRKTFDSLPRLLLNRRHIVISRSMHPRAEVAVARSLQEAITLAEADQGSNEYFIIGGGEIYREALPLATRMIVTHIDRDYRCTTTFPSIESSIWFHVEGPQQTSESGLNFRINHYRRK
jgi:dihydrofolate reductase